MYYPFDILSYKEANLIGILAQPYAGGSPIVRSILTNSSHWQLKDLICKSSSSNSVYYPSKTSVNELSFDGQKPTQKQKKPSPSNTDQIYLDPSDNESAVAEFCCSPRCIKENGGVIAIGGLTSGPTTPNSRYSRMKGHFGYHITQTGFTGSAQIGALINNCVSVNKLSHYNYKSLLCNNDQNLYLINIPLDGRPIVPDYSVSMGVALNHASLSPDNKTIVAVGDTSRIFLLHPEEDMRSIAKRDMITTMSDCGFSTCWNGSGYQFSACFQEGVDFIYDVRNISKPVHVIESTRKQSQNGAFRVCKYSEGMDDLLFIAEHQGRVHVIDTRNFMTHHVIMLPKQLYSCEDGYYNQPIVKEYDDVLRVQHELGYISSSQHFVANVDSGLMRKSQFFTYGQDDCPRRFASKSGRKCHKRHPEGVTVVDNTVRYETTGDQQCVYDTLTQPAYVRIGSPSNIPDINEEIPNYSWIQATNRSVTPLNDPFFFLDSELAVCGLEVMDSNAGRGGGHRSLVIGTENGLIHWDIDSWQRMCFPSCEFA